MNGDSSGTGPVTSSSGGADGDAGPGGTGGGRAREVERIVAGQRTSDGAGVRLTRLLTQDLQRRLDPFLMLDAFGSDDPDEYIAGFPNHPHRGFETVTLMIEGRMRHRDSAGHEGLLSTGGVQWMTAGRGLIHSEMPEQVEGRMEGYQLWLNLPADAKLCDPGYRDIAPDEIPVYRTPQGVQARVVAGELHGLRGAVQRDTTEPLFLDLTLPAGATLAFALPAEFNAFVCTYRGELLVGDARTAVPAGRMGILETADDAERVTLGASMPTRAIVVAGRPLREAIVQYGPFVMNSTEQIREAIADFQAGRMR